MGKPAAMTFIEATTMYLGSGMAGNIEPEWSGAGRSWGAKSVVVWLSISEQAPTCPEVIPIYSRIRLYPFCVGGPKPVRLQHNLLFLVRVVRLVPRRDDASITPSSEALLGTSGNSGL